LTTYIPQPDRRIELDSSDGVPFVTHHWQAEEPRGVVIFLHGPNMGGRRYAPFFETLTTAKFSVYAQDYPGHGETAGSIEALGKGGGDAWDGTARDTVQLLDLVLQEQPGLPVFLIEYSIGVALALRIAQERDSDLTGLVLIGGSGGSPEPDYSLLILLIQEVQAVGRQGRSLIQKAIFESFNRPFEPAITPFDWLSRDTRAVMDYIHDPL
jgi:alpha-beta hydrolase superfamily lysophospholipase